MQPASVVGVILAGGQSRRFGENKAFADLAGISLVRHVMARAAPQVGVLLVSAGLDDPRFAALGLIVLRDELTGGPDGPLGPLAGIHAALRWVESHRPEARWLASFSVDTPLVPADLVARLRQAAEEQGAEIACARSAGRLHPLLALWSPRLAEEVRDALDRGERAAHRFIERHRAVVVDFPAEPFDPFSNVNTPEDLARLSQRLAR